MIASFSSMGSWFPVVGQVMTSVILDNDNPLKVLTAGAGARLQVMQKRELLLCQR